jgi:hypothetical protein
MRVTPAQERQAGPEFLECLKMYHVEPSIKKNRNAESLNSREPCRESHGNLEDQSRIGGRKNILLGRTEKGQAFAARAFSVIGGSEMPLGDIQARFAALTYKARFVTFLAR